MIILCSKLIRPVRLYSNVSLLSELFALEKKYAILLRDFAEARAISHGEALHSRILKTIPNPDLFLCNSLINMYSKCGFVQNARRVFDEMPERDVISWNTIIDGYFLAEMFPYVLQFFRCMLHSGVALDEFSFTSICRSCLALEAFGNGLAVHCLVIKCGFGGNAFVANGLVEVYAKCHFLRESLKVFVDVEHKDIVLVNTLIGLLAKAGNFEEAFLIFLDNVLIASMWPERATFLLIC
ncbi:pentatricopeptide repeat-containing protein At3g63370, chloroplastic-like [Dioscorea cayenensis subsp. rotundata]|uniref:Pentatricopeptide repeat-containing protein At3g63370, chloroplastic-like n=1 Tax=Dioscorea cayennensis subsp. rotundata TaxID=55577 RepID=A0AB40BTT4_DIOCR|nr:pentatricopeptide repeat-containing protein At3g63370, chloroplastic-like [Dioscorea cayenensis subsp. rotundata]